MESAPLGIVIWIASGFAAFAAARMIPLGRGSRRREFAIGALSGVVLGSAATALDFGGWREPDWRAAVFVFAGAFAALGISRVLRQLRRKEPRIV